MSADSLDEVPDAASPFVYSEKSRRDARQAFREKYGRDPTEEEVHMNIDKEDLERLTLKMVEELGREPTMEEYKVACESGGIPAAHLQSYLAHHGTVEGQKMAEAAFFKEHGRATTDEELGKFLAATVPRGRGLADAGLLVTCLCHNPTTTYRREI